jgi:hypothetical protein
LVFHRRIPPPIKVRHMIRGGRCESGAACLQGQACLRLTTSLTLFVPKLIPRRSGVNPPGPLPVARRGLAAPAGLHAWGVALLRERRRHAHPQIQRRPPGHPGWMAAEVVPGHPVLQDTERMAAIRSA